jgi:hypothetical protein
MTRVTLTNIRGRTGNRYKRGDKTGLNRVCSKFNSYQGEYVINTSNEIILGANDYRDLVISKFVEERSKTRIPTITETLEVSGNMQSSLAYIKDVYPDEYMFSAGTSRVVIQLSDCLIEIESGASTIDFRFHGTFKVNELHRVKALEKFDQISTYISWIYDEHMNRVNIPIDNSMLPVDEMYNCLGDETLEEYYNRFKESSAGILILIGPPGTGKTSFIRGYLASTNSSAYVTYDPRIISSDGLFAEFIESNSNTLVIEDADLFLSARKDGNDMIHRFLNVGDGLIKIPNKKLIFSTNLPSVRDIDEALIRPGRCHAVLHFTPLNNEETDALTEKFNITYDKSEKSEHTISEIFSGIKTSSRKVKKGFGFC